MRGPIVAAALALAAVTSPAHAFVVEVTTSVAVADAEDQGTLKTALQSAVDGVLKEAIAFTPTLVVLTRAVVVGDRLYVRLLLADAEGEQSFKDLSEPDTAPASPSASPRTEI